MRKIGDAIFPSGHPAGKRPRRRLQILVETEIDEYVEFDYTILTKENVS